MVQVAETSASIGLVSSYTLAGRVVLNTGLPYDQTVFSGRDVCRRQLLGGISWTPRSSPGAWASVSASTTAPTVRQVAGPARRRFLAHHRPGLEHARYRLSRRRLAQAALAEAADLLFNPKKTAGRLAASLGLRRLA
jgi:hypothetical protein